MCACECICFYRVDINALYTIKGLILLHFKINKFLLLDVTSSKNDSWCCHGINTSFRFKKKK